MKHNYLKIFLDLEKTTNYNKFLELNGPKKEQFLKIYDKKRIKNILITYLYVFLGMHYFLMGENLKGFIYLLTFGGLGFWFIDDLCRIRDIHYEYNNKAQVNSLNEAMSYK